MNSSKKKIQPQAEDLKNLKPFSNLSLVDRVEMRLREYFNEANLQPGDALPKEVDLASYMGVSRTAIREALARLKMLGLVESKRNRGMVLTHPDVLGNFERVLDPLLLDSNTLQDIFELRLVLEIGIADLLFLRKTHESLEKLEAIVDKEEAISDKLLKTRYDVEFHSMLYNISGNKTIQRFQKMLLPIFNYVHNGTFYPRTEVANPISHRMLLETLKHGTTREFREKMKIHLQVYFDKVDE